MKYFGILVFASFLFFSCTDKFEDPKKGAGEDYSFRYFPLVAGHYIIYDADSIVHSYIDDNTSNPDSIKIYFRYQLKEQVDSSFIDGEGEQAWYVSRYRRDADTLPWQFINVWTAKRTAIAAQRVEDNNRYVKLAFPVAGNKQWNGNAFNHFSDEDYTYSEVNAPMSIGGYGFDSSVTVIQKYDDNLIQRIVKQEKYAIGLGMVFKEADSLGKIKLGITTFFTNGYEYRLTLKDYFPK